MRTGPTADTTVYLSVILHQYTYTNPLDVQVALDTGRQARHVVPPSGGTFEVTAANGTKSALPVPNGGLWVTQTITRTVVSALPGLPLSGAAAVVDFEPDGLQFIQPAVLTIDLAAPIPPTNRCSSSTTRTGRTRGCTRRFSIAANPGRIAILAPHSMT